ncbi:MAG: DUF7309 domain-containing protein [Christensenellales bacterium]|jgi:hypothetical protein
MKIPDSMYDLAYRFKKAKLWEKLWDTELFAVRHADGEIGYCCIMGRLGEHTAIAVYTGDEGMYSFQRISEHVPVTNDRENLERSTSQNCVSLSFGGKEDMLPETLEEVRDYNKRCVIVARGAKAFPVFEKFEPRHLMWKITRQEDAARIRDALEAALEVAEKLKTHTPEQLGFTDGEPFDRKIPLLEKAEKGYTWSDIMLPPRFAVRYPESGAYDDITLAKIRKAKQNRRDWALHICLEPEPLYGENEDEAGDTAPFFSFLLIVIDEHMQEILSAEISPDSERYPQDFRSALAKTIIGKGRPKAIHCINDRTQAFLREIARQTGISVLRQARNAFIERWLEDEDEMYRKGMEGEEAFDEELLEGLWDAIRSPEVRGSMPDMLVRDMYAQIGKGLLPADIEEIIRAEKKARNL